MFNRSTTVFTTTVQSMLLNNASTWTQIIVSSVQIFALVWAGFKYINRVTRKLDKLDDINKRLDKLETQYKPNGGSSMRDAVNRIEKQIDKLQDRFEKHIDNNNNNNR